MKSELLALLKDSRIEDGVFVADNRIKKSGWEFPSHWHDYYELEIIAEGTGIHMYNNNQTKYSKGNAYILSYCDYHSYEIAENTTFVNICFDERLLPPNIARYISAGISKCNCKFSEEELAQVISLAKTLKKETHSKEMFNKEIITALLINIIVCIIRKSNAADSCEISDLVQNAVSYVYKNFRKEISLKETAELLHVSPNYLGVKFKNSMGMPFKTYINVIRLRYCCNLLMSTNMSVKEIAYSGGYTSLEYFLQVFKKTLGITPTEYRNKNNHKGGVSR